MMMSGARRDTALSAILSKMEVGREVEGGRGVCTCLFSTSFKRPEPALRMSESELAMLFMPMSWAEGSTIFVKGWADAGL